MRILLLLSTLVGAIGTAAMADLNLAQNGRSEYRIVIAADAIPSERYAAEQLQHYLERMSGAKLAIVDDTEAMAAHEILVGDSWHAREFLPDPRLADLGPDGFVLRADGGHLLIMGGKPRGTLNGVYTLLEEKLGVRWFTPELEKVPRLERVSLADLNETQVPALENRDVFWREMMRDADFAAKHRLNGQHYNLTEKHGGAFARYHPFVHSFDMLVAPELFKDHPEYFPMIDGQRKGGYVQRCLSHPDVLKLSIEKVKQWIRDHPDANIISVSQNDTINNCQCPECKAVDDAEGTPAGSLLKYVNAIAEAIEKDHPNVRIDTLAYQYTRKAPKNIRPHRNVIVRLCSIECCFAHPLESCPAEANRAFRDDIIAWEPVAPLLYVWDYTPNFAHYQQPFPNFDSLQPNVRFFVNHGVKSLFEQGNYSGGGYGELGPLRAYVLAKLLWNPDTDVQKHIDEFLGAYYGAAAGSMKEYLAWATAQVRGKDCHAHIFDSPSACYLNDAFLQDADRILTTAEARAENDAVRSRVEVARLPIWYVQIVRDRVKGEEKTALIRRFLAVARGTGISNISEGMTLEAWAKKIKAD